MIKNDKKLDKIGNLAYKAIKQFMWCVEKYEY